MTAEVALGSGLFAEVANRSVCVCCVYRNDGRVSCVVFTELVNRTLRLVHRSD